MVWTLETSKGFEQRKCRNRIIEFLRGVILDVGCGDEKITPRSIGVDREGKGADIRMDLSKTKALSLFANKQFDTVFSSHFLEHIADYKGMLREMWRVLKENGYLVLYLPHKNLYPRIGEEGANPTHRHDFLPEDILEKMAEIGSYRLVRNVTHSEDDEYSFELVLQKLDVGDARLHFQYEPEKITKKAIVIRYGGFGDVAIATPVYRLLKAQGYHVSANITPDGIAVLENNPYVDEMLVQDRDIVPNQMLDDLFAEYAKKYDRVVNLCESIEKTLLFEKKHPEYSLTKEERHEIANVNYSDRTMEMAGFPDRGLRPELYISEGEDVLCRMFKKKHEGTFNILVQLSGSSWHKLTPWAEDVIDEIVETMPDAKVFLTGGENVRIIGWEDKRVLNRIGMWTMRQTAIITKYMDLVLSPETGVLNCAGAFSTPKIGLLTHSSIENLTKYFLNDYSIEANVKCSPCHKLVHSIDECPRGEKYLLPICCEEGFTKERIMEKVYEVYGNWARSQCRIS